MGQKVKIFKKKISFSESSFHTTFKNPGIRMLTHTWFILARSNVCLIRSYYIITDKRVLDHKNGQRISNVYPYYMVRVFSELWNEQMHLMAILKDNRTSNWSTNFDRRADSLGEQFENLAGVWTTILFMECSLSKFRENADQRLLKIVSKL